jgi:hypothetical protein
MITLLRDNMIFVSFVASWKYVILSWSLRVGWTLCQVILSYRIKSGNGIYRQYLTVLSCCRDVYVTVEAPVEGQMREAGRARSPVSRIDPSAFRKLLCRTTQTCENDKMKRNCPNPQCLLLVSYTQSTCTSTCLLGKPTVAQLFTKFPISTEPRFKC